MRKIGTEELPDYRHDPEAYELEERSRPDEMRMIQTAGEWAARWLDGLRDARAIDLCCGTGLSMEALTCHPHVLRLVGVDTEPNYLDFAARKYAAAHNQPELIRGDAVTVPLPEGYWDVVMMASAYHHIEDARKVFFLERVGRLLSGSGRVFFAENLLPEYRTEDPADYARAVREFYTEVLVTARAENPTLSDHVARLIERVVRYGIDGEYEYKTSRSIFLNHLRQTGFTIERLERVWPAEKPQLGGTGGNYVVVARRG